MDRSSSPRQRLDQFRQSLASPDDRGNLSPETATGHAVIWSSAPDGKSQDMTLQQKLQGSASRHAVRKEVKQLLRENHIQITTDIKKALPSRLTAGNPTRLCQLISPASMPLQLSDIDSLRPHLQSELGKLIVAAGDGNGVSLADFLIKDAGSVRNALVALIQPSLVVDAENIASEAFEAFARSLMFGRTIDQAVNRAFQESSASFKKLKPGKELIDMQECIADILNTEMAKVGGAKPSQENSILPALMIAAFIPVFAKALESRQKLFHFAVEENCTVLGAQKSAVEEWGFQKRPKTEINSADLWKLRPAAIAEQLAADIQSTMA